MTTSLRGRSRSSSPVDTAVLPFRRGGPKWSAAELPLERETGERGPRRGDTRTVTGTALPLCPGLTDVAQLQDGGVAFCAFAGSIIRLLLRGSGF